MNVVCSLKRIRKERGLTQGELSELTGIDRISITRYETGKITPGGKALRKLAMALDVSVDEIIGEEETDHAEAEEDRGGEAAGRVGGGGQEAEGPDLRVARDDGPHPGGAGGDDGPEPGDDVQPAGAAGDLAPGGTEKIKIHYRRGGDIVMTYEKYYWQEGPIVNADRWMKWEALRIFMNTLQAAKLANKSIRRENRRIRRTQRGKWM